MKKISFIPESFAGRFSQAEMDSIARMVRLDLPEFTIDKEYSKFICEFHGGKPVQKYFTTASGKCLPIEYFLNFQDIQNNHFDQLNVNVVWSAVNDRLSIDLVPFATTPGGDLLCFKTLSGERPNVMLWDHELSEEDSPVTEFVSTDFSQFVDSLQVEWNAT